MMLKVKIISAEEALYDGSGEMAILPGAEGEFAVLPEHVAMIVTLRAGNIRVKQAKEEVVFTISGGIAHITENKVEILADS